SPIAEILDEQLAPWIVDAEDVQMVLDLCTGSGCLAILAALAFPQAQVDAVDVSPDALAVADANVKAYELDGRLTTHQSDLFEQMPPCEYDLIICNPPYVNSDSMARLPREYLHEPALALAGGTDGMDLIRRILDRAAEFLAPQGLLVLEVGNEA